MVNRLQESVENDKERFKNLQNKYIGEYSAALN